jgi:adenine-specific DNA-methyltransferase
MTTNSQAFNQLCKFLKDMFQFEEHDLDFGIYRITRLKRQYIQAFIDGDADDSLRSTVSHALGNLQNSQSETARNWLAAFAAQFGDMGRPLWQAVAENPEDEIAQAQFKGLLAMPVLSDEQRQQAEIQLNAFIDTRQLSTEQLEAKVYNHLLNFFELYYQNGDFGYNTRAASAFKVPYEADYDGSDTLFHWKHKDSYYIKTGNGFHSVRCQIEGKWLEFRLTSGGDENAETSERNNNKDAVSKHYRLVDIQQTEEIDADGNSKVVWQVRFALAASSTTKVELYTQIWKTIFQDDNDLTPYLHKKPGKGDPETGKPVFNELTNDFDKSDGGQVKGISQLRLNFDRYIDELVKRSEFADLGSNATEREKELKNDWVANALWQLDRNLNKFYVGNDSDYFIHKDLLGFLTREKSRFIKQVVFSDLDALLHASEDNATTLIARAFNQVADKLISFLAAIENFQKSLFELKKKVVDTHYLVSVGKIPTPFHERVFANETQRKEWRDTFKVEMVAPAELVEHPTLVVDTSLFRETDPTFQDDLLSLSEFDNLDEQIDGLLINSENWQALNLLQEKFREQIKCIYIDPPYNTGGDGFLYKDSFRHSSWASMIHDRLEIGKSLLKTDGVFFASIDYRERGNFEQMLNLHFGEGNRVEELIWAQNTNDNRAPAYSTNHEYVLAYAKDKASATASSRMFRETRPGYAEIMDLTEELSAEYTEPEAAGSAIKALMAEHREAYKKELQEIGLTYNKETQKQDPWRGIYNYNRVEYRDSHGQFTAFEDARKKKATLWAWREADSSAPPKDDARKITDSSDPNYRFYKPLHPDTGKPCNHPNGGWRLRFAPDADDPNKDSFSARAQDYRIVWGDDEKKIPQLKRFLHEVGGNGGEDEGGMAVPKSVVHDYTDGAKQIESLFGEKGIFRFPKPTTLMGRLFEQTTEVGDWVADFFVGSGTSAHAALRLNKEYGSGQGRRFLAVEMGEYADAVVKQRIKRVMFSLSWKGGVPSNENGLRNIVKVNQLEQYEDLLDNLTPVWDEATLPMQVPVRYLFRPEHHQISSSLDMARPFDQALRVGKAREERSIDLMETWFYLQGYWVRSRRVYRPETNSNLDRKYLAVETTHGTLVVFRDIEPAEDDTANLKSILANYVDEQGNSRIQRLEVNFDVDLRRLDIEANLIQASDFLRGAQWS